MAIYIGYRTSLLLYASPRCAGLVNMPTSDIVSISDAETSVPVARNLSLQTVCGVTGLPQCPLPRIDVLGASAARRTTTPILASHVWSTSLPPNCFKQVARDAYLATPEFSFLLMAQTLSPIRLMVLGMAMCGRYWPANTHGHMLKKPAMTSAERIGAFLDNVPAGTDGLRRAKVASSWIEDNAWSPMESSTYLLLCLPRTMGGYGLPRPQLNREYPLSREAQSIVQQETCFVDLSWPQSAYGIEYYGAEYHRETERDLARELALRHEGVELLPVSYRQVKNPSERNEIAAQSARHLGHRMRSMTERMKNKRHSLIQEAFARGRFTTDGCYELELPDHALPSALCA